MALQNPNDKKGVLNQFEFALKVIQHQAKAPGNAANFVKKHGYREKGVNFYAAQHIHFQLPFKIGYKIVSKSKNQSKSWTDAINRAIKIINTRCPGIAIKEDDEKEYDHQLKFILGKKDGCHTIGNFIEDKKVKITLDRKWDKADRNGTVLHELLHALGFEHTHQRGDAVKNGVQYNKANCMDGMSDQEWEDDWADQYVPDDNIVGVVPYDPHSIMNYPNYNCEFDIEEGKWTAYADNSVMKGGDERDVLSALDEVAINLVYRPPDTDKYKPKRSKYNGLHYCGRKGMMVGHNYPKPDMADVCGPDIGPNCGACRVLQNAKIPKKNDKGRTVWQGSSGAFYCGHKVKDGYTQGGKVEVDDDFEPWDGYCGPNAGAQCLSCYRLNYLDYIE